MGTSSGAYELNQECASRTDTVVLSMNERFQIFLVALDSAFTKTNLQCSNFTSVFASLKTFLMSQYFN